MANEDQPGIRIFGKPKSRLASTTTTTTASSSIPPLPRPPVEKATDSNPTAPSHTTFSELGLAEWACTTCKELGMKTPTPVQRNCIPRILAGEDVLGIAQTGSGKTAAFALPILHRFAEDPFGVFALVMNHVINHVLDQVVLQL